MDDYETIAGDLDLRIFSIVVASRDGPLEVRTKTIIVKSDVTWNT